MKGVAWKIYEGGTVARMNRPHPPDENEPNVAKALMGSQQVPQDFQRRLILPGLDSTQGPVGSSPYDIGRCVRHRAVHRVGRR
jgi:hypothetical protein